MSFYPQQTLPLTSWIITAVKLPSSVWLIYSTRGSVSLMSLRGIKVLFYRNLLVDWSSRQHAAGSGSAGCGSRLVVLNVGQKVVKEVNQSPLFLLSILSYSSKKKAASFHFTFIWCNFRCEGNLHPHRCTIQPWQQFHTRGHMTILTNPLGFAFFFSLCLLLSWHIKTGYQTCPRGERRGLQQVQ